MLHKCGCPVGAASSPQAGLGAATQSAHTTTNQWAGTHNGWLGGAGCSAPQGPGQGRLGVGQGCLGGWPALGWGLAGYIPGIYPVFPNTGIYLVFQTPENPIPGICAAIV